VDKSPSRPGGGRAGRSLAVSIPNTRRKSSDHVFARSRVRGEYPAVENQVPRCSHQRDHATTIEEAQNPLAHFLDQRLDFFLARRKHRMEHATLAVYVEAR
jgi:hypothetical protein